MTRLERDLAITLSILKGPMPHWKIYTDRELLSACDLEGKETTVTISQVVGAEVTAPGGKKNKRPVVSFEGRTKKLVLNSTNAKTIANMYGPYTEKWIGKSITIFPTTTTFGPDTVDAIRIRPGIPKVNGKQNKADPDTWVPEPPPDGEP